MHEKAPVRLMNKPNLGMAVAIIPVNKTMTVLSTMFLMYGFYYSNGFRLSLNALEFSVMSIAGKIWMG